METNSIFYIVVGVVFILVLFFMINRQKKDTKENIFEKINFWIMSSEASLVNLLSAIAPWGAPTGAAYSTYFHSVEYLGYPDWVAFILALVVEILGLSTINTALAFWSHNKQRQYRANEKQAPLWAPISAFGFYLVVIILVNVIIDIAKAQDAIDGGDRMIWAAIISRGLLILLSIPAALIMGVRTQHRAMLTRLYKDERTKQPSRRAENGQEESPIVRNDEKKKPKRKTKSKIAYDFVQSFVQQTGRLPTTSEVVDQTEVKSRSTVNPAINLFIVRNADKLLDLEVIKSDRLEKAQEFIKKLEEANA